MLQFRLAFFVTALVVITPFAALAYWAISLQGDAALANLSFSSPGAIAAEPFLRWAVENRYESAGTSIITGAISLAWYYSKMKNRELERVLVAIDKPRRRHRW